MAWIEILILCSGIEPGQPRGKPGILATRSARLKAELPWCLLPVESKNVSTRQRLLKKAQSFLLETQYNTWESMQGRVYLSKAEAKQQYPPKGGAQVQASFWMRSTPERWLKLIWGGSSRSLSSFGQLSCFIFHSWPDPAPSQICVCIFWPRWIPEQGIMGRLSRLIMVWHPLPFWLKEVSLCMCNWGLPTPEDGEYVTSGSFAQAGLSPSFWSCHYHCLTSSQKTSTSYVPCASCDFYLVVNVYPRAHLSSASWSVNRRLLANVYPGAHLFPALRRPAKWAKYEVKVAQWSAITTQENDDDEGLS